MGQHLDKMALFASEEKVTSYSYSYFQSFLQASIHFSLFYHGQSIPSLMLQAQDYVSSKPFPPQTLFILVVQLTQG